MNTAGRTPEQSGIEAGTITPVVHTTGAGKRINMYRVQYNTMYFKYSKRSIAEQKVQAWEESGRKK